MPWPNFGALLLAMHREMGVIRGLLESNTDRLDRIEDRLNAPKPEAHGISWKDLLPHLSGWITGLLLLLLSWLTGSPVGALRAALGIGG
jgi:hypothetical protein